MEITLFVRFEEIIDTVEKIKVERRNHKMLVNVMDKRLRGDVDDDLSLSTFELYQQIMKGKDADKKLKEEWLKLMKEEGELRDKIIQLIDEEELTPIFGFKKQKNSSMACNLGGMSFVMNNK